MAKALNIDYTRFMPRLTTNRAETAPQPDTAKLAPAGWLESLERSDAQIAAGQTVALEPVLGKLRESIVRMEAKRAGTGAK